MQLGSLTPENAYAAVCVGVLLIYLELLRPGLVLSGVAGLGLLLWGGYWLNRSSVDPWAVAFSVAAFACLAADAARETGGLAAVGFIGFLAAGSFRMVCAPPHLRSGSVAVCGGCLGLISAMLARASRQARENKRIVEIGDCGTDHPMMT